MGLEGSWRCEAVSRRCRPRHLTTGEVPLTDQERGEPDQVPHLRSPCHETLLVLLRRGHEEGSAVVRPQEEIEIRDGVCGRPHREGEGILGRRRRDKLSTKGASGRRSESTPRWES